MSRGGMQRRLQRQKETRTKLATGATKWRNKGMKEEEKREEKIGRIEMGEKSELMRRERIARRVTRVLSGDLVVAPNNCSVARAIAMESGALFGEGCTAVIFRDSVKGRRYLAVS